MNANTLALQMVIQACKNHLLSHTMIGLEIDGEFNKTTPIIEQFHGEEHTAYGSGVFYVLDSKVCIFNTYGDEDLPEHYSETLDKTVSVGYCLNIDGYFYCFDVMENGDVVRLMKSKESISFDPLLFASKRSFYHYRDDQKLSLSNYYDGVGYQHVAARRWSSGPRTFFDLVETSL